MRSKICNWRATLLIFGFLSVGSESAIAKCQGLVQWGLSPGGCANAEVAPDPTPVITNHLQSITHLVEAIASRDEATIKRVMGEVLFASPTCVLCRELHRKVLPTLRDDQADYIVGSGFFRLLETGNPQLVMFDVLENSARAYDIDPRIVRASESVGKSLDRQGELRPKDVANGIMASPRKTGAAYDRNSANFAWWPQYQSPPKTANKQRLAWWSSAKCISIIHGTKIVAGFSDGYPSIGSATMGTLTLPFWNVDLQQGDLIELQAGGNPCPGWTDASQSMLNVPKGGMILERIARGAEPITWLFFGRVAKAEDYPPSLADGNLPPPPFSTSDFPPMPPLVSED